MSVEQNRQIALSYFKRTVEENTGVIEDLLTKDCQWWAPGIGTMDKTTFKALIEQMRPVMPTMPSMTITGVTAEGDRVAMEAKGSGKLADGRMYENTYHFLFVFRNGRICAVKEYNDTKYAAEVFGTVIAPG